MTPITVHYAMSGWSRYAALNGASSVTDGLNGRPRLSQSWIRGGKVMIDYNQLGRRIQRIRHERGLTQAELAERADVSPPYISHIERGVKTASLDTLAKIAESLGVALDSLLLGQPGSDQHTYGAEISDLLDECTTVQKQIIYDIATATKSILRNYL
jgi:transcriptional regulator with XRE-family HTH domain